MKPIRKTFDRGIETVAQDMDGLMERPRLSLDGLEQFPHVSPAVRPGADLATTLELGGMNHTEADQAREYAEAILAFLAEQGLIAGDWPAAPEACCEAVPFDGTELLYPPHPGVVSFLQPVGAYVEVGTALFEVLDPLDDRRSVVHAGTAGVLFAIERMRFAQPGRWLAKVAGRTPIRQGRLLSD